MTGKTLKFTRRADARHITEVRFDGASRVSARIFSPERGLLGTPVFHVRFFDRFGDATGDRHEFPRFCDAREFVIDCFIEGLVS